MKLNLKLEGHHFFYKPLLNTNHLSVLKQKLIFNFNKIDNKSDYYGLKLFINNLRSSICEDKFFNFALKYDMNNKPSKSYFY